MKQKRAFHLDLNESFPHMADAPIVEAVIHWRARAGKALTSEGLRQQLVGQLPSYPDCRPQHHLELEAQFSGDSASHVQRQTWEGFRLTSADKLHIVQFTRDGVAFSRLTPYEDWDAFAAEGQRLWRVFVELAEPAEVQRLGVRYINRIGLTDIGQIGRYLAKPPECLDPLDLPASQFLYQSLHDVPDHPYQINVVQTVQASVPPQTQELGLILDIDVGTTQALPCEDTGLQECLTEMRWLKNKAFFSLLSEKAVTLFQGGNP